MNSKDSENDMAIKAAELAKQVDEKFKTFAIAALIVITDKFMPEEYLNKLLEVLKMTRLEKIIREEGREEGREEEKIEIAKNMLRKGIDIETIAEVTGLKPDEINQIKIHAVN